MRKRLTGFSVLLGICFALSGCRDTSQVDQDTPTLSSQTAETTELDQWLTDIDFQGVVLVAEQNKELFKKAYGEANQATGRKNSVDIAYPIASMQKQFTACLIAELVETNELSYDDPLSDFYPEVPYSDQITIADLLNHTSGIRMDELAPQAALLSEEEQIAYVCQEMVVTEDQSFAYTNANYTLLAGILWQQTGESYETRFTQTFIQPLGLQHTFFWDTWPTDESFPLSYAEDLETGTDFPMISSFETITPLMSSLLGAGNMLMSIDDVWTVEKAIQGGQLIDGQAYQSLQDLSTDAYSSGIWRTEQAEYNEGYLAGYASMIYEDTAKDRTIILLSNRVNDLDTYTLAEIIAEE